MPFSHLEENMPKILNRYALKLWQLPLARDTGLSCGKFLELWVARQLALWKKTRAQIQNRESQTSLVCLRLRLRTQEFYSVGGVTPEALTLHFCKPIYPFTSQVPPVTKPPAYSTQRTPGAWWLGTQGIIAAALGCNPTGLLPRKRGWSCLLSKANECSQNSVCQVSRERLPQLCAKREQFAVTQPHSSQKCCQWTSICFMEGVTRRTMESAQEWLPFRSSYLPSDLDLCQGEHHCAFLTAFL